MFRCPFIWSVGFWLVIQCYRNRVKHHDKAEPCSPLSKWVYGWQLNTIIQSLLHIFWLIMKIQECIWDNLLSGIKSRHPVCFYLWLSHMDIFNLYNPNEATHLKGMFFYLWLPYIWFKSCKLIWLTHFSFLTVHRTFFKILMPYRKIARNHLINMDDYNLLWKWPLDEVTVFQLFLFFSSFFLFLLLFVQNKYKTYSVLKCTV